MEQSQPERDRVARLYLRASRIYHVRSLGLDRRAEKEADLEKRILVQMQLANARGDKAAFDKAWEEGSTLNPFERKKQSAESQLEAVRYATAHDSVKACGSGLWKRCASGCPSGCTRHVVTRCNRIGCPSCARARALDLVHEWAPKLADLEDTRTLTLTIPNVGAGHLAKACDLLMDAFKRLSRRKWFMDRWDAGVRALEVTYKHGWHPHLHVIVGTVDQTWADGPASAWPQRTNVKWVTCETCKGKGTIPDHGSCSLCRGKGLRRVRYCLKPRMLPVRWAEDTRDFLSRQPPEWTRGSEWSDLRLEWSKCVALARLPKRSGKKDRAEVEEECDAAHARWLRAKKTGRQIRGKALGPLLVCFIKEPFYVRYDPCPKCGGSGMRSGAVCWECDGKGKLRVEVTERMAGDDQQERRRIREAATREAIKYVSDGLPKMPGSRAIELIQAKEGRRWLQGFGRLHAQGERACRTCRRECPTCQQCKDGVERDLDLATLTFVHHTDTGGVVPCVSCGGSVWRLKDRADQDGKAGEERETCPCCGAMGETLADIEKEDAETECEHGFSFDRGEYVIVPFETWALLAPSGLWHPRSERGPPRSQGPLP